jgi:hypothetical protein
MLAAGQHGIHKVVPSPRTALKRVRATKAPIDANFIFDIGTQKACVCESSYQWMLVKWFDYGVVAPFKQREALFIPHQMLSIAFSGVNPKVRSAEVTASCQYHSASWPAGTSSYTAALYHV